MALPVYLAMTAAELAQCEHISHPVAWMACHFSSYGPGLGNLPRQLCAGSVLILNDRIPIQGHDPDTVKGQLLEIVEEFSVSGVLLDLQRQGSPQTAAVARAVTEALPCPVAVSEYYARELSCPVFLEAPRCYHHLKDRVSQWPGRELWLEASFSPGMVTVTKGGSSYTSGGEFPEALPICRSEELFCSYCIQKTDKKVCYYFRRSAEDLLRLLEEAKALGFTRAVGLYQELADTFPCDP